MLKQYKVNAQIGVAQVRLIGQDGKQVGILSRDEALDYALGSGADLVLIGEKANPPVAKIVDFKKFLYQEQKKHAEERKGQRRTGVKEVIVGSPFTAPADVAARVKKTGELLKKGFSVRVVVKFYGRQMAHQEFGQRIMSEFKQQLALFSEVERDTRMERKRMVTTFTPKKKD